MYVSMSNLWHETSVVLKLFFQNKNPLITRKKRRIGQLMTSKNFCFDQHKLSSVLLSFSEQLLNRDTKLISILRRQYCIILTTLKENIFSLLDSVASEYIFFQLVVNIYMRYGPRRKKQKKGRGQ